MPSRPSLTSSFPITDSLNEVVCPLENQDGSLCRKKCFGEKMYRSMQEHIRRAHPEYHIPKLPATKESFDMMISTGPHPEAAGPKDYHHHRPSSSSYYSSDSKNPATPKQQDDRVLGKAHAAAVLAELGNTSSFYEVGGLDRDYYGDYEATARGHPRSSIELPPLHSLTAENVTSDPHRANGPQRHRELLPSLYDTSPPERSSTLPPLPRALGPYRPRKQSITKRARDGYHHQKKNSREFMKRIGGPDDLYQRLMAQERKAQSAEPATNGLGSPWESLLQAASEAGDIEDRTPMPRSPVSVQRTSIPPISHAPRGHGPYQASPLQQQALTPPLYNQDALVPFPSLESGDSGETFHIGSQGLSDSSPSYSSQNTQIYCAGCRSISLLKQSYACTECISGLCAECVSVLTSEQGDKRKCPHCATIGGRYKLIQLDIR